MSRTLLWIAALTGCAGRPTSSNTLDLEVVAVRHEFRAPDPAWDAPAVIEDSYDCRARTSPLEITRGHVRVPNGGIRIETAPPARISIDVTTATTRSECGRWVGTDSQQRNHPEAVHIVGIGIPPVTATFIDATADAMTITAQTDFTAGTTWIERVAFEPPHPIRVEVPLILCECRVSIRYEANTDTDPGMLTSIFPARSSSESLALR